MALRYLAPSWEPSPWPISAAAQALRRTGICLDGPIYGLHQLRSYVSAAGSYRGIGDSFAVQRDRTGSILSWSVCHHGEPCACAAVAYGASEHVAEVSQRLY